MTADPGLRTEHSELERELAACHRAAFAWARNCCRSHPTDTEDVLQTSYLKVLDGRARFDGRSAFTTWLFAVIHRTAADHRRRGFLRNLLALRWDAEVALHEPAPAADSWVEQRQQRQRLSQALSRLPRRQREVLLLVFYHEFTVEDAAQVLAIGVGSARQHYARGKLRLRELLGQGRGTQ